MSLEGLKTGDKVVVHSHFGTALSTVGRVTKRTAMAGPHSYRLSDGMRADMGLGVIPLWITRPTPEDIADHEADSHRRSLVATLEGAGWDNLPVETLEAVAKLVETRKLKEGA